MRKSRKPPNLWPNLQPGDKVRFRCYDWDYVVEVIETSYSAFHRAWGIRGYFSVSGEKPVTGFFVGVEQLKKT